jgi:hypothetical protein
MCNRRTIRKRLKRQKKKGGRLPVNLVKLAKIAISPVLGKGLVSSSASAGSRLLRQADSTGKSGDDLGIGNGKMFKLCFRLIDLSGACRCEVDPALSDHVHIDCSGSP